MPETPDPSTGCVLVVDDNALVRMLGADALEDAGYAVIEAANADEALEILRGARAVRLLFTDVDMPGSMNGLELADLVHRRWPEIRLLVTSGHHLLADADVPDACRFVAKPYSQVTVIAEVAALLAEPHCAPG